MEHQFAWHWWWVSKLHIAECKELYHLCTTHITVTRWDIWGLFIALYFVWQFYKKTRTDNYVPCLQVVIASVHWCRIVLLQYTELHNVDSELPVYRFNVEEYAHLMTQNVLNLTLRRNPALTAIREFLLSNTN